jgi:hypothetical protein
MWKWLMSLDPWTRAALIGGAATLLSVIGALIGVFLNLAWNRKKYQDEKAASLRREVYVNAIPVIHRAMSYLRSRILTGKPTKQKDITPHEDISDALSGICAQLRILGSKRVVAAVVAFEMRFEQWLLRLSATKTLFDQLEQGHIALVKEVEHRSREVATLKSQRDEASRVLIQWKSEADHHGAVPGDAVKQALKSWEEAGTRLDQIRKETDRIAEANVASGIKRFENLETGIDGFLAVDKEFAPLLDEITVAMKVDLGLPSDEQWYKETMSKEWERAYIEHAKALETSPAVKNLHTQLAELRRRKSTSPNLPITETEDTAA